MNHKIAIISTYDPDVKDSCGVALYAKLTGDHLEKVGNKIDYATISRPRAKSDFEGMKNDIIKKAKQSEVIILHYEPGQFATREKALRIFESIIELGKKTIVNFHFLRIVPKNCKKPIWYKNLSKKKRNKNRDKNLIYKELQHNLKIFELLKKHKDRVGSIFHQKYLSDYVKTFGVDSFHQPIPFLTTDKINNFRSRDLRREFIEKYKLDSSKTYIGISGFASSYKGIHDLITAFSFLPENFELVICSNLYPEGSNKTTVDGYILELNNRITHFSAERDKALCSDKEVKNFERNSFLKRIHYINHLNDDDFNFVTGAIDILVLPYYDSGQSASGPLSIASAISQSGKIIVSSIKAFTEFDQYYPGIVQFIDPGNVVELVSKINLISRLDSKPLREKMHNTYDKYGIDKVTDNFLKIINRKATT